MTSNSPTNEYVVKETATLNWTINDFSILTSYIFSEQFSFFNSKNKYKLYLIPKAKFLNNTDDVFVSLHYYANENKLQMRYRVSILNSNGLKQYTQEYQWKYCKTGLNSRHENINFTNFIDCHSCSRYLVNGSLILNCEVDVLEKSQVAPNKTYLPDDNCQTTLQKDYQAMLENSEFSDVVLLVKKKEFKVHKNILAARSKVFRAMFSNDLKEKKQNKVEISDIEAEVFEHLLRYIYTDKISEIDEFALELFVAADKYQLDYLKSKCEQSLCSNLTTESVVNVLVIADMHNASELKSKCIEYINANSNAVKKTEEWKQIKSRPALLLELYENITAKVESMSTNVKEFD